MTRVLLLLALAGFLPDGMQPMPRPSGRKLVFTDDSNTKAHPYFNTLGIHDTQTNTWTQNGTVPLVAPSGKLPEGAGPFSDVNYYSLGTGADVLDNGVFTDCIAFYVNTLPSAAQVLLANGANSNSGYYIVINNQGSKEGDIVINRAGGAVVVPTANVVTVGAHVLCTGYDGTNGLSNLDGATTASTVATYLVDSTHTAKLGRYDGTGASSASMLVFEMWHSATTPTTTNLKTLAAAALAKMQ